MGNIFKAEVLVGKTDNDDFIAIYDTKRLKFCFLADTEQKLLEKVDAALSLYVEHKLVPRARLKAEFIPSLEALALEQRSVIREIPVIA